MGKKSKAAVAAIITPIKFYLYRGDDFEVSMELRSNNTCVVCLLVYRTPLLYMLCVYGKVVESIKDSKLYGLQAVEVWNRFNYKNLGLDDKTDGCIRLKYNEDGTCSIHNLFALVPERVMKSINIRTTLHVVTMTQQNEFSMHLPQSAISDQWASVGAWLTNTYSTSGQKFIVENFDKLKQFKNNKEEEQPTATTVQ